MLSVAEAQAKVVEGLKPLGSRARFAGRRARPRAERATSPRTARNRPLDVSAMDGYAVRAQDVATLPASLKVIGTVAAGAMFQGAVGKGEAVRIFTGAPVPKGADDDRHPREHKGEGDTVHVVDGAAPAGRHIRRAGTRLQEGRQAAQEPGAV